MRVDFLCIRTRFQIIVKQAIKSKHTLVWSKCFTPPLTILSPSFWECGLGAGRGVLIARPEPSYLRRPIRFACLS